MSSQLGVMIGGVVTFAGDVGVLNQNEWMLCDGRELKKGDYPDLFNVIGESWGGDGTGNFNLPDFRGMFLRGAGQNKESSLQYNGDSGRKIATIQKNAVQNHGHTSIFKIAPDAYNQRSNEGRHFPNLMGYVTEAGPGILQVDSALNANIADETRPNNYAVNWVIRVK